MGRQENKETWTEETIREYLRKSAKAEEIPESLKPDRMETWLKENTEKNRREAMDNKKGILIVVSGFSGSVGSDGVASGSGAAGAS